MTNDGEQREPSDVSEANQMTAKHLSPYCASAVWS